MSESKLEFAERLAEKQGRVLSPLERAIALAGGLTRLAERLSTPTETVLSQHIVNWRKRGVPEGRCLAIEEAVAGAVTCHDLRPDKFPAPPVKAAA